MPDRAVVDLNLSGDERNMILDFLHRSLARIDRDRQDAGRQDNVEGTLRLHGERRACELVMSALLDKPAPRAVVAISEDRQWLVVLAPSSHAESEPSFGIFRFSERWWSWEPERTKTDTGQDAADVLADWLAGRGG